MHLTVRRMLSLPWLRRGRILDTFRNRTMDYYFLSLWKCLVLIFLATTDHIVTFHNQNVVEMQSMRVGGLMPAYYVASYDEHTCMLLGTNSSPGF